jgi:hypothetical protein
MVSRHLACCRFTAHSGLARIPGLIWKLGIFCRFTVGLAMSFAMVSLLQPSLPAPWRWASQGVTLHAGLWLMLHAVLVLVLGRPWFAMAIGRLAFLMLLVQVSNAKFHSLREPFVFQDFEYFTDAIRHPRLYIPFLGWWKFALIVVAVAAALAVGIWLEAAPAGRFSLDGQLGEVGLHLLIAAGLLFIFNGGPELDFDLEADPQRLGFLGCLWRYAWAEQSPMTIQNQLPDVGALAPDYPDLLVVQSESFFDPRSYFPGIRTDVLAEFDQLNAESLCHGQLRVPAWGSQYGSQRIRLFERCHRSDAGGSSIQSVSSDTESGCSFAGGGTEGCWIPNSLHPSLCGYVLWPRQGVSIPRI